MQMAPLPSLLSCLPFLLVTLLLSLFAWRSRRVKTQKFPPGPPKLPIIGNLHQIRGLAHRSLWQLSKQYGSLMYLQLGSVPAVAISSAKMAKMVLKTLDLDFCGRPDLISYRTFSYNFLDVAFAPYGEGWRQMRKVCTLELFSSKRVQSSRFIREEEVNQFVGNISKSCQWRGVVNLSEMLFSLTNNITCRAALGKSYQVGDGERSRFHQVLTEGEELSVAFFVADYFPSLGWVDVITGKQGRLRKVFLDLDGFYEEVIEEHLNLSRSETLEQEDFVDVLIKVQKELGLTRDHIKAVLMNIFFGGTDSSSTLMEWTMTELMKNKKVLKKAQEEVRRVAAGKAKVEEYDLNQLHYLKSAIKETLRLHPPAPLLVPHATTRDCNVYGYDIPAKTRVFVNVFAIGRDPESWDSPEDFIPERFSDDSIDYKGSNFELIPFGAGRRGCPGINLGMVIVELALANLLYAFDWEFPCGSCEEEEDENEAEGIAMHRRSPLLLVPKAHISS